MNTFFSSPPPLSTTLSSAPTVGAKDIRQTYVLIRAGRGVWEAADGREATTRQTYKSTAPTPRARIIPLRMVQQSSGQTTPPPLCLNMMALLSLKPTN